MNYLLKKFYLRFHSFARISPEKILPSIGTASFSKNKQNWQYDPWLRQFSTWFICRATNGRNNTSDASILETSIQVHASVSADLYDKNGLNPYAREYFQSSPPVQMGQGSSKLEKLR